VALGAAFGGEERRVDPSSLQLTRLLLVATDAEIGETLLQMLREVGRMGIVATSTVLLGRFVPVVSRSVELRDLLVTGPAELGGGATEQLGMTARVGVVADRAVLAELQGAVAFRPPEDRRLLVALEAEAVPDLLAEQEQFTGPPVGVVAPGALSGGDRGVGLPLEPEKPFVAVATQFGTLELGLERVAPIDRDVTRGADPECDRTVVLLSPEILVAAAGDAGVPRFPVGSVRALGEPRGRILDRVGRLG
jgi:hypothetical protein